MPRYIDAEIFGFIHFKDRPDKTYADGIQRVMAFVDSLPSADVRENVRGEWLPHKTKHYDLWECSICHSAALLDQFGIMERSAYCPYCGTKMEVEE